MFLDAGIVVEKGTARTIFSMPEHERTRRFIASLTQEPVEDEGSGI